MSLFVVYVFFVLIDVFNTFFNIYSWKINWDKWWNCNFIFIFWLINFLLFFFFLFFLDLISFFIDKSIEKQLIFKNVSKLLFGSLEIKEENMILSNHHTILKAIVIILQNFTLIHLFLWLWRNIMTAKLISNYQRHIFKILVSICILFATTKLSWDDFSCFGSINHEFFRCVIPIL